MMLIFMPDATVIIGRENASDYQRIVYSDFGKTICQKKEGRVLKKF